MKLAKKDDIDPVRNPAQMPMNDQESSVIPNKGGGYAPNYTPTCLIDGTKSFIVDTNVLAASTKRSNWSHVDRTTEMLGEKPDNVLTDSGNAAGSVLAGLEARGITSFAPAKSSEHAADSSVRRADLTQLVPESQRPFPNLSDHKQLDKSSLVYDEEHDQYFCPMGPVLKRTDKEIRNGFPLPLYIAGLQRLVSIFLHRGGIKFERCR